MRLFITISLFYFFISCNQKIEETKESIIVDAIEIPEIRENRKDTLFLLRNGVLYFDKKPYSGVVEEFYGNGNLKSKSEYFNGKREGSYFGFYPNQKKWFERFYTKGVKVKTHKGWFINDQLMFEYQFNKSGVYNGYAKDWHSNGQLAKHFNFVNGKETGSQKMWKPSGKIRANFYTINGERHGLIGLKNCISVISNESK